MQWYYSKGGSQNGPISQEVLVSKISTGEIYQSDMVWKEGMPDWLPVGQVTELAAVIRPVRSGNTPTPLAGAEASSHASPGSQMPVQSVPNYLWQSIVITILCCWPLGIPAIVFAARVDNLLASGDVDGAKIASKKAKMWCLISLFTGIVVIGLAGAAVVLAGFAQALALGRPSL